MGKLYHWIRRLFKRKHDDVARHLPPEALAAVRREADFLRAAHRVEVNGLQPGETPSAPRAADPAVEARLNAAQPERSSPN